MNCLQVNFSHKHVWLATTSRNTESFQFRRHNGSYLENWGYWTTATFFSICGNTLFLDCLVWPAGTIYWVCIWTAVCQLMTPGMTMVWYQEWPNYSGKTHVPNRFSIHFVMFISLVTEHWLERCVYHFHYPLFITLFSICPSLPVSRHTERRVPERAPFWVGPPIGLVVQRPTAVVQ